MNHGVGARLVVAVLLGATPAAMAQPIRPLRAVTINVLHGGVLSGLVGDGQALERRLAILGDELAQLDADVIGLQEASAGRGRGQVAARLGARLGLYQVYAPTSFRLFPVEWVNRLTAGLLNFTEGPALLSRFPVRAWAVHDLPRCGRPTDVRVLLHAELETPWGRLSAFSTHTSGDACQTARVAELVQARRGALPAVLMGDFNATEASPAIAVLVRDAGFLDAFRAVNPEAPGFTVWQRVDAPGPTVSRRIDYLFLVPGTERPGRVRTSRVVLNVPRQLEDGRGLWPSDHYGVLAEIDVLGAR